MKNEDIDLIFGLVRAQNYNPTRPESAHVVVVRRLAGLVLVKGNETK